MKMTDLINGFIFILGLGLLLASIFLFLRTQKFMQSAIRTDAVLIENKMVQSSDKDNRSGSWMYQPVLEYEVNGKKMTFSPNVKSNPPQYNLNEKVQVMYDPNVPDKAQIIGYYHLFLGSIICMLFGLPMFVTTLGYFLFKFGVF